MKSITKFIEEKLYLKVNKEKSQLAPFHMVKFLGYSFYRNPRRKVRLRIHPKSVLRMKVKQMSHNTAQIIPSKARAYP